jgi:methyl-accepting chemotaxis protein
MQADYTLLAERQKCDKVHTYLNVLIKLLVCVVLVLLAVFLGQLLVKKIPDKLDNVIDQGTIFFTDTASNEINYFNRMLGDIEYNFRNTTDKLQIIIDEIHHVELINLLRLAVYNLNKLDTYILQIFEKIIK